MALVPRPDPERRERQVAAVLFFVTCCTVFIVHWVGWQGVSALESGGRALSFTLALMGILLIHELGHVALARQHGFQIGWPWFLPFPLFVGTLGAVIRLRETPRTRHGLLEMGVAGPITGLLAVILVLVIRQLTGSDDAPPAGPITLSTPLVVHLVSVVATGGWSSGISTTEPLGFAAWIGCLVTAMNLLPLGQLDGGHVLSAVAPGHARRVGWLTTGVLLLAGLSWPGWAVWAAVLHLMGARHAADVRSEAPPPRPASRRAVVLAVSAFLLTFTPVPIALGPGPG